MPLGKQSTFSEAAIIGASCILPGANSVASFWDLLLRGGNIVSARPQGRWNVERFLRPGEPVPGFAYSFAGGYLDDAFGFDPAPFNISPREAQQMDPQQRLLLTAAWRACEDAGLPPSALAGRDVGVYVGASLADYQSAGAFDPAVIGSHFMTGNALSILANRLSYVFDLKGPSFTVDAACSSSFVALAQAVSALRAGEVELAIVGGVNMLLSPVPFIGFSQARMLSPTGLCRPFSEDADGYVRSEGAVVLVLQREPEAIAAGRRIHSVIVAAATNADGRTNGISLPSQGSQQRLIETIYETAKLAPDTLAFVEAHGTGTKIGDPIEAAAIGEGLARRRAAPLPIGSVKSNIGHLEAASGLASLLKTSLALEHRLVPRSLFAEARNTAIPFEELNLAPITQALSLGSDGGHLFAGICNYGFGGTNGHAILRTARRPEAACAGGASSPAAQALLVSASTAEALKVHASQVADAISGGLSAECAASALAYQRETLPHRLAVPVQAASAGSEAVAASLRAFGQGSDLRGRGAAAVVHGGSRSAVFVFSGNGVQFAQMGHLAYRANAAFRREIDEIDALYAGIAGWSVAEHLRDGVSTEQLERTSIAQPLIFAVQSALGAVLAEYGIRPAGVLGHSVGEIAAAECCGLISRRDALRVMYKRSHHQEAVRGSGRMLVLASGAAKVEELLLQAGMEQVDVAAYNSATSTTVSGPADQLDILARLARRSRIAAVPLHVDYPFHSRALDPVRSALIGDLAGIVTQPPRIPFYSGVTGSPLVREELDAFYWWRNIRHPVRFADAVQAALTAHPDAAFIEIAPRALLMGPLADVLRANEVQNPILPTLSANDPADQDPIRAVVARMAANGISHDREAVFGAPPRAVEILPPYPFQPEQYRFDTTTEAIGVHGRLIASVPLHPLLGARVSDGAPEWRNLLDPVLLPYLDDHRVDGGVVMPAAALIELALAAGSELFGPVPLEIAEFDITKAMTFADDETREVSTRYSERSGTVEIWSRRRFAAGDWILHARGTIAPLRDAAAVLRPGIPVVETRPILSEAAEIYAAAERAGLDYGPRFRAVISTRRDETVGESSLVVPEGGTGAYEDRHILHPVSLDAGFHGLFLARPQRDGERKAHLPIRFRHIRIWKPEAKITRAVTKLMRETDRFKTLSLALLDGNDDLAASIEAAVLRSVHLVKPFMIERTFREEHLAIAPMRLPGIPVAAPAVSTEASAEARPLALLLKAFSISLANSLCRGLLSPERNGSVESVVIDGIVAPAAEPLFAMARDILALAGGLEEFEGGTRLSPRFVIPSPESLLGTLMQRFPEANRELRLAAQALSRAGPFLRKGEVEARATGFVSDHWSLLGLSAAMRAVASRTLAAWTSAAARPLRVLVAGGWNGGLTEALAEAVQAGRIRVTLAAANADRAEEQRHWPGVGSLFDMLVLDGIGTSAPCRFDALIGFDMPLSPFRDTSAAAIRGSLDLLVGDAPILLAEPCEDLHLSFLLGASTPSIWQDRAGLPHGGSAALHRCLEDARATAIETGRSADASLTLASARSAPVEAALAAASVAVVTEPGTGDPRARYGLLAAELFDRDGIEALPGWLAALPLGARATLVVDPGAPEATSVGRLSGRIETLVALAKLLAGTERPCRLLVLTGSAYAGDAEQAGEDAGVRAFARVAMNEFPEIDLRLVDIASASPSDALAEVLTFDNAEREVRITGSGIEISRIRRGIDIETPLGPDERAVLHFADGVGLEGFEWLRQPRRAPGAGEIEVEIVAAGLNYRDVMVGLGLLDDDLLGAGLTRAALGFECAGRVSRIGAGVTGLQPGDAVMGFAGGAFASHVVCPDWHFFPVPDGLALEAAATIPVAFSTAWYALVERGGIRAGEAVLVHGAAGGVGLAAIQIAKLHGARVLGTASSAARRAIATAAGADAVFDSRQERFAEAIRRQVGLVDVVLNSLAGPAMLASFRLLKPFGRFLELGKRDFLDNTQLALRPFLRNIAYSGVDLDELLEADPALVRAMMAQLAEAFATQSLRPLAYRSFEAYEVGAAFRTMQASEHVGKIVIRPPRAARADLASLSYAAPPGLYIVVGGTAGFGFATARWLAQKGATHVALLSRRGEVEAELAPQLAEMRAAGTEVVVEALDVRDGPAVQQTIARLARDHAPLRGVVHAAVHLDDGLIANLSPERLEAVLRTKVDGIVNLSKATEGHALDLFVAYSSATTLIGSPGQGAYVAANGFLEGFMRRRRVQGKPGLAIGWGAISDVGLIARDKQLGQRLRRATGVVPMRAFEALAHLGRLLSLGDAVDPVQFFAGISPGSGAEKLNLLKSAAFLDLAQPGGDARAVHAEDLGASLRGKSREEAIGIVTGVLRREVAAILRMAEGKVDLTRPLADLGLDSLMALELHMALETAIGVQIAVVGAADRSLVDMAGTIVDQLEQPEEEAGPAPPENMQATIIRLANVHSKMDLSLEQANRIDEMVRRPSRGAAE